MPCPCRVLQLLCGALAFASCGSPLAIIKKIHSPVDFKDCYLLIVALPIKIKCPFAICDRRCFY